ncbi:TetR/AcrR family transcriptional regulator [Paenibacillus donghaensis]|uniref:TetR family transcriptional regulator n=1 Tax=Paenibacillus donghaensis TaxID=414771 RepID=A0A2Z2K961_9BACL|nr:TetR/AcrR family transcriptional regulator [Paenibacillus donghaensis]ASA23216.1 TetR family transcriptional regulator [Paenibacillus donghaensis]
MARSKEFEIDTVLGRAMAVFWRQGYEKTSMQDLVIAMGIHKRSMYDTFGDKHSLFIQALERYAAMAAGRMQERLEPLSSSREGIRLLFELMIHPAEEEPRGCLLVNTATELALDDPLAASRVEQSFARTEQLLELLVRQGQESGEIASSLPPAVLAACLHNALVGLRVMARLTADRDRLEQIAEATLVLLDK